ncbi:tetraacyldisaccharide 4'-kinase [Candidatus Desantisbacteria bacterium]|nr:tetraacyldisaccharide 4'-kinase [Candidatus Desantisbacteria bacterium]
MMIMYLREIMLGKRKGLIIRQILGVLSFVYLILIKIRMAGYKYGFLRGKKLPVRVISIGNLTVGGSGKTPAIIEIASLLKDAGKRIGVLIRGYHSRYEQQQGVVSGNVAEASPLRISTNTVSASLEDAGDEACLLAKNLTGIPVLAGKNRWASGRYALEKFGCDTLLLDDGFQHLKLYRDIDILLHDVSIPQQGLRLFPEGVLREPLSAAKRARIIILTHTDMVTDLTPYEDMVKGLNPKALILTSIHLPLHLIRYKRDEEDSNIYPLSLIKGKTILACSGIGCPESFEHNLKQFEPHRIIPLRFPDHHSYDSACLRRIEEMARDTDMVVTTEKDMVRLAAKVGCVPRTHISCPLFFLKVKFSITTPNWQENLLRCLCSD